MLNFDLKMLSKELISIVSEASIQIIKIYNQPSIQLNSKKDGSPVTEADLVSHKIINQGLQALNLDIPILSEEQNHFSEVNKKVEAFWLVDPLDGTKEFIKGNGEFTVNIALIVNGIPVLGAVEAPALSTTFIGISGDGAYKIKNKDKTKLITRPITKDLCRIFISRSHQSTADTRLIRIAGRNFKKVELIKAGSSLKLCRIAEGLGDIYPRLGPTFQWDIAAGQVVLESAGGIIRDLSGNKISYIFDHTKRNPDFLALGDKNEEWFDGLIRKFKN